MLDESTVLLERDREGFTVPLNHDHANAVKHRTQYNNDVSKQYHEHSFELLNLRITAACPLHRPPPVKSH